MGLPGSEGQFDDSLNRFYTVPSCDGQTNRQTSSLYQ